MPVEVNDNTRVARPIIIKTPRKVQRPVRLTTRTSVQVPQNQAQLYDADKVKAAEDKQNFYNNNFWGYGVGGTQTKINPRTPQGQAAIQANFDYAKSNMEGAVLDVAIPTAIQGAGQTYRWATTPVQIGEGAEAIVSSSPISTTVTKVTTIPRSEMHVRNMVPNVLKSEPVSTTNGLTKYIQSKVRIPLGKSYNKAVERLTTQMQNKGWWPITHPNLQGPAYTNGLQVVYDLGPGNIGKNWLGRSTIVDGTVSNMSGFTGAMMRKGGILKPPYLK